MTHYVRKISGNESSTWSSLHISARVRVYHILLEILSRASKGTSQVVFHFQSSRRGRVADYESFTGHKLLPAFIKDAYYEVARLLIQHRATQMFVFIKAESRACNVRKWP